MTTVVDLLERERVLAIIRTTDAATAFTALEGLVAGGIRLAEISLSPPGADAILRDAIARFGDQLTLGAGTVRTPHQAEQSIADGARFLVAPGFDEHVLATATRLGVPHVPGVMTPTEVDRALALGAPMLKLFPAGHVGPSYVRELLAPFPEAAFVATGGVDPGNAAAFLDAGAIALGVASALVPSTAQLRAEDVEARARGLLRSLTNPTPEELHGH